MARLWSSGFELNSSSQGVEWTTQSSSPSVQGTTVRSGGYAMEVVSMTSGTPEAVSFTHHASNNTGPIYTRSYFRIATMPSAENRILVQRNSSGTHIVYITLDNGGLLRLYDEDGVIGSASSALSTGTWYRVETKIDATAGGGSHIVEAKIDGTAFATSSARNLSSGVTRYGIGGNWNSEAQTTGDWFFDDVAINDSTGSFQTSYPGDGKIIHLRPSAAGDNAQWTPDSGSNYARVQEVSPDGDTSYVRNSVTLNQADDYNIDASGLASTDTINLVAVGVRTRGETGTPFYSFTVRAKKDTGGTISESASITPTGISYFTNAPTDPTIYPLTLYQNPDSSNWTNSTLDTMQIGVKTSATSTNRIRVSTLWALVDYTPDAGGGGSGTGDVITVIM